MKFKEISSIFSYFGAEGKIEISILPRRKVEKMSKELEFHRQMGEIKYFVMGASKSLLFGLSR